MYYAILLYHDVYERFLSFFLITDIFVKLPFKKISLGKYFFVLTAEPAICRCAACGVFNLQCTAAQVSQALSICP